MSYKDFSIFMEDVVDSAMLNPTQKNMKDLIKIVKSMQNNMDMMIKMLKNNDDRISDINQTMIEMFPDMEVIQTMADDQEERKKMFHDYLGLNDMY